MDQDHTLSHPTDTDPNRFDGDTSRLRPPSGALRNNFGGNGAAAAAAAASGGGGVGVNPQRGTAGNPLLQLPSTEAGDFTPREGDDSLARSNNQQQMTEIPHVAAAVNVPPAPNMVRPGRRGKGGNVAAASNNNDNNNSIAANGGVSDDSGSIAMTSSQMHSPADFVNPMIALVPVDYTLGDASPHQSGGYNPMAQSTALDARKKNMAAASTGRDGKPFKRQQQNTLFASMMLGGKERPEMDISDSVSNAGRSARGGDAAPNSPGSQRRASAMVLDGGLIAALPNDDGQTLIPASIEAPEQLFMPNMKREPYVPVRLARDKIKQALAEIAAHNSKHYAAIDTMEKQYDILRAQMEHQVAAYAKKLTMHYNQRVAALDAQLKDKLTSGKKGETIKQMMLDVAKWKSRAQDAEEELERVKRQLEEERMANRARDVRAAAMGSSAAPISTSAAIGIPPPVAASGGRPTSSSSAHGSRGNGAAPAANPYLGEDDDV